MVSHVWPLFLAAYILGSIPTALVLTRLFAGKDIRALGDGNMGARNVFRSVSRPLGLIVGILDILKGALAIRFAQAWIISDGALLIVALCVTLGHDFPLFAHFRGGQGMATIIGIFGVLFPQETVLALVAFAVVLILSHNWDLSCAAAFVLLVAVMGLAGQPVRRMVYPFILLPTIGGSKLIQRWQAAHRPSHASGR
jgi:glycerol-3-phosphate acyltransferase PlsY